MGLWDFLDRLAIRKLAFGLDDLFSKGRRNWYRQTVQTLKFLSSSTGDVVDLSIRNDRLFGEAELATKALQVYLTTWFVSRKQYVPPPDDTTFAIYLGERILGTDLQRAQEYEDGYSNCNGDCDQLSIQFSSAISPHVFETLRSQNTVALAELSKTLFNVTLFAVAVGFDDGETAARLAREEYS